MIELVVINGGDYLWVEEATGGLLIVMKVRIFT